MTEILSLEHMAIVPTGPTLSMSVRAGQSLAVVGPSSSGKTHFLQVIAGIERPAQGSVRIHGSLAIASAEGVSRRAKVQALIPRSDLTPRGLRVADLLYKMRLGEARFKQIGDLSPGQFAAYELLGPLIGDANLILIDGQLDHLDPWALHDAMAIIRSLQSKGVAIVAATNRPDLVAQFDAAIVLKDKQVRFAGSIEDLKRLGPPHSIQVATARQEGVRALVAPFQVHVSQTDEGLKFETPEGQQLAARLLLEGYGDVQYVISRPPTLEETLLSLI
jgi:ABC-type multidrug transport system ATPase subunit